MKLEFIVHFNNYGVCSFIAKLWSHAATYKCLILFLDACNISSVINIDQNLIVYVIFIH